MKKYFRINTLLTTIIITICVLNTSISIAGITAIKSEIHDFKCDLSNAHIIKDIDDISPSLFNIPDTDFNNIKKQDTDKLKQSAFLDSFFVHNKHAIVNFSLFKVTRDLLRNLCYCEDNIVDQTALMHFAIVKELEHLTDQQVPGTEIHCCANKDNKDNSEVCYGVETINKDSGSVKKEKHVTLSKLDRALKFTEFTKKKAIDIFNKKQTDQKYNSKSYLKKEIKKEIKKEKEKEIKTHLEESKEDIDAKLKLVSNTMLGVIATSIRNHDEFIIAIQKNCNLECYLHDTIQEYTNKAHYINNFLHEWLKAPNSISLDNILIELIDCEAIYQDKINVESPLNTTTLSDIINAIFTFTDFYLEENLLQTITEIKDSSKLQNIKKEIKGIIYSGIDENQPKTTSSTDILGCSCIADTLVSDKSYILYIDALEYDKSLFLENMDSILKKAIESDLSEDSRFKHIMPTLQLVDALWISQEINDSTVNWNGLLELIKDNITKLTKKKELPRSLINNNAPIASTQETSPPCDAVIIINDDTETSNNNPVIIIKDDTETSNNNPDIIIKDDTETLNITINL